jgi:DNA modification methylase
VTEPYYSYAGIEIYHGDALACLRELPADSVHCCVTSPPYWGLRDYGTAEWEGGDAECDHRANGERRQIPHGDGRPIETDGYAQNRTLIAGAGANFKDTCGKCGATRIDRQLGLEKTPEEYVAKMVAVFRDVRRVLRGDGTLWLNMGDSYAGAGPSGASYQSKTTVEREGKSRDGNFAISKTLGARGLTYAEKKPIPPPGLKPKDLCGIPWMLAFALRADGWYLRQDIIWSKPNPMPESVTDRCTKAHEYLFLLAKSKQYYYNQEAIKEPAIADHAAGNNNHKYATAYLEGDEHHRTKLGLVDYAQRQRSAAGKWAAEAPNANGKRMTDNVQAARAKGATHGNPFDDTRNKRSVWQIATQPFREAHFAIFPEELVKHCILAGCPAGGVVLDPFGGSMTTMKVARDLNCKGVAIELNAEYIEIGQRRLRQDVLDFQGVV